MGYKESVIFHTVLKMTIGDCITHCGVSSTTENNVRTYYLAQNGQNFETQFYKLSFLNLSKFVSNETPKILIQVKNTFLLNRSQSKPLLLVCHCCRVVRQKHLSQKEGNSSHLTHQWGIYIHNKQWASIVVVAAFFNGILLSKHLFEIEVCQALMLQCNDQQLHKIKTFNWPGNEANLIKEHIG